ncbi:MAG: biopolymer transporter ExbD [Prevotella sp.]|nr:biopolymer transporter ExbD [Prevotella sp.]
MLNTTSTADISFMLLIFFLVTSSMDTDKGLTRQLPPPDDTTEMEDRHIKERNVLALRIDAAGQMSCNGDSITRDELTRRVEEFVANRNDDPTLPEKSRREVHLLGLCHVSDRHVITIETHANTPYESYFDMQDAIVRGYNNLRNELAQQRFRHSFAQCSPEERASITLVYPQRISEKQPTTDAEANGATMQEGGSL